MTIHALIADDEALSRRVLRQLLARHADVVVTAECSNGAETIAAIATPGLDVAFLDVCMPLASGLDVACGGVRPLVVFVTAFDDFAARAFDVDAVDYLLKPIDDDRFDAAVDRVRERVRLRRLDAARAEAVTGSSARTTPPYLRQLVARVGQREIIVPLDDVELLRADDVYVDVHAKGRRHVVRTSLDALERVLDPAQFLRVHRSFIVPIARMREYFSLYNIGAIIAHSPGAKAYFDRMPGVRLDATHGALHVYTVEGESSYFLAGSGRVVERGHNRLTLSDLVGPEVVLKYHYVPGMASDPPVRIDGVRMLDDPNPFVRIKEPPPRLRLYMP